MDPTSRDLAIAPRQLRAALAPGALVALSAILAAACGDTRELGARPVAVGDCPVDQPDCRGVPTDGSDLSIQKRHLGTFTPGHTGVFELGVSNNGNAAASPVIVTDVLDPAFTFVSAGPNPPWSCTATATPPQTVICTYTAGALPAQTSAVPIQLTVQIGDHTGDLRNCAEVSGGGHDLDPTPADNTACDTVALTTCPPLDHNLSSGVNDQTQGAIPDGSRDDTWRVVAFTPGSPHGGDDDAWDNAGPPPPPPTGIEDTTPDPPSPLHTAPMYVGAPYIVSFPPWSGAGWMTPLVNPSNPTQPSGSAAAGSYVYETCFCLSSDFSDPLLDLTLRADNWITSVELNGCTIFSGAAGHFNITPLHVQETNPSCFRPGQNCVQIDVWNNEVYTGLKVDGAVSATNAGTCCPSSCP